jgi:DNA-binding MarR family transcriptional regulator
MAACREIEDLGWVTRKVHAANRSSNLIHITAKGKKELGAAGTRFLSRIHGALEGLPARELAQLERVSALAEMWMAGISRRPRPQSTTKRSL